MSRRLPEHQGPAAASRRFAHPAAWLAMLVGLTLGCAPAAAPTWGTSTLSFFEPVADGLAWVRFDPDGAGEGEAKGRRAVITTVPAATGSPQVAWRADQLRALVWHDDRYGEAVEGARPAPLWDVDVAAGTRVEVAPPAGVKLEMIGFDAGGQAIALAMTEWQERDNALKDAKGRYLMLEGQRYDVPADMLDGLPVLVHAYALTPERTWRRFETIVSDTGWDLASGVERLEAAKTLGSRTPDLLGAQPEGTDIEDKNVRERLTVAVPRTRGAEGSWRRLQPVTVGLDVWFEQGGEFEHATDLMVFVGEPPTRVPHLTIPSPEAKAMVRGEGSTGARATAPQLRGDRLLVSDAYDGEHPRLLDLRTRQLVYSSDVAKAAVFWPAAAGPATGSASPEAAATPGAVVTPTAD